MSVRRNDPSDPPPRWGHPREENRREGGPVPPAPGGDPAPARAPEGDPTPDRAPETNPTPARASDGDPVPTRAAVVVVGGGIVGCALAGRLAEAGIDTAVLERHSPGRAATAAAAGMLSPLAEAEREGPFLELGMQSLAGYADFVREVEEASGLNVEYRRAGKLQVALTDQEAERLERRADFARTWSGGVELLDGSAAARAEPGTSGEARAGLLLPDDHRVDSRRLGLAVHRWARRRGAAVVQGVEVAGLLREGGRIRGVRLRDGTRVSSEWVVVAAGCWSGALEGVPRRLPVEPVRGQMVALGPGPVHPSRAVESRTVYLVPRDDGRLLAGSTEEKVGYRPRTSAEGVARILTAAMELLPDVAHHPVLEAWAGLRPGTPDRLPILGPDPEAPGLLYATGHFRNGILLAPETARILTEWVASGGRGDGEELLGPFLPGRFA